MFLTKDFLKQYDKQKPPFTELGEFVYYRTYSRLDLKKKRRENWAETAQRAVEYNIGLEMKHREAAGLPIDYATYQKLQAEAEALFDNHFNLRQFLSGRSLWVGGTPVADRFALSNFNCAFLVLDSFEDFAELFYLLMVGTGCGVRVLESDVAKFSTYRKVELVMDEFNPVPKAERREHSCVNKLGDEATILVGDSKDGWVDALKFYFGIITMPYWENIQKISVNFDNVRPKGEPLKTFGGTASGHESLRTMFEKIHNVLCNAGGTLRPIDCLDIANIIGENVVVGGVRRTSEIGIFSPTDNEVLTAKANLYFEDEDGWHENLPLLHRRMSNNSVFFESKPSRKQLHDVFQRLKATGEPGFINAETLRQRRADGKGLNPCAEILLDDKQCCNLTTVNAMAFVSLGRLDKANFLKTLELAGRAGLRMTLTDLELPEWDEKQKRDRLTGVSVTGWQDMMDACGLSKYDEEVLLAKMKRVVRRAVDSYAEELGINKPLLATTVKPEGTLSQLPTVSSGLHYSHSPYYIRRVRINAHDPLCKVAEDLGWVVKPEVGQTEENCNTKVIEFPCMSPVNRTKYDVTAIEQLENYKRFMTWYVEHNASITVTVRDDEWEAVEKWVWDNWDSVVAISFLALDSHTYPLAPYEAITALEYAERKAAMKPFDPKLLSKYQVVEEFDQTQDKADCSTGACPIR